MGNKPNRDSRPQINFEVAGELKAQFNGKVKSKSLNSKDVLTRYVEAFLADHPAALQIASGNLTSQANTRSNTPGTGTQSPQKSVPGRTEVNNTINPSEYSEWIKVLEGILTSGHAVAIEAVIRNLQAFDVLIRSNAEGRVGNYKLPKPSDLARNITREVERLERAKAADRSRNAANTRRAG